MNYGCQSMVGKITDILLKSPKDAFISQENLERNYEAFNYIGCPNYEKTLKEYEIFEGIIKKNVENVYYLPKDDRTGLDSIYAHDSLKVTKKGAIYFPMGKNLRSKESLVTEEFLKSHGVPTLGRIEAPGKMEGGDIVWLDERTVAIGLGYRTNKEGIEQFKKLTKDFIDEYIIVPMPHGEGKDECLHLMSVISLVDDDLAVVYSKFMPVFFREYLIKRGIKLLEVNDKEYAYLGSNVLALDKRKCIIIEGVPEIQKKLEDEGCTVYTYPGKELSFRGTGGPTCLTHPICRK
ncbi:dimethylarginine dimethylaminohydrolase family protein [Peptoniphilus lacrimalis]|uniref:N(G),N(G)-dimethylarginine dimethylaminohydrolase n=1 Tax=Peptoniphilus lacrimalis TaxID=33031 RepID=A0A379C2F9_9FIRM|nr:arginine deiminase family protein [Peptoniphilus lacrimalis]SUB56423.1 N(G),N(G)-dimethylarginine dimethylaminohydrolase [Peptoniphilus lacrimalis]